MNFSNWGNWEPVAETELNMIPIEMSINKPKKIRKCKIKPKPKEKKYYINI